MQTFLQAPERGYLQQKVQDLTTEKQNFIYTADVEPCVLLTTVRGRHTRKCAPKESKNTHCLDTRLYRCTGCQPSTTFVIKRQNSFVNVLRRGIIASILSSSGRMDMDRPGGLDAASKIIRQTRRRISLHVTKSCQRQT
jgi:hypothetical protein